MCVRGVFYRDGKGVGKALPFCGYGHLALFGGGKAGKINSVAYDCGITVAVCNRKGGSAAVEGVAYGIFGLCGERGQLCIGRNGIFDRNGEGGAFAHEFDRDGMLADVTQLRASDKGISCVVCFGRTCGVFHRKYKPVEVKHLSGEVFAFLRLAQHADRGYDPYVRFEGRHKPSV